MIPYLLAALLLAEHVEPEQQKQINSIVAQIKRLAASEPVVYGVDTRLRAADVLTAKYPKIAKDLLRDAQAALSGDNVPAEQDSLRVSIVQRMAPLDLEEAERLIGSIRRGGDEDYVALAYDRLVEFVAREHGNTREMISRGLQAGGFRSNSAAKLLDDSKKTDAPAAVALFSEILGAFPAQSAYEADIHFLLACTRQIAPLNRPLAVEALDRALNEATSKKLHIEKAARRKLLREIASTLGSIDAELLAQYKTEHDELVEALSAKEEPKADATKKEDVQPPDLSGDSYSDALSVARALKDPTERVAALIEIYRRETISAQQRSSVASEALTAATAMPITNDRLTAMAMISRDFARVNQPANAAFAAQLLSETFSKACDCEHETCERSGEKFECVNLLDLFSEYLEEFKISAESMSINNISLEARMLIFKLYPLLGLKPPAMWSFGN